jgi:hypothetical protein
MNNDSDFYGALNEVLATSRYDRLMGRRVNLWEIISERVNNLIERVFSRINFNLPGNLDYNLNIISSTFIVIGIILVIAAALVLYRTFGGRRKMADHDLADIFEELAKKNYTVAELMRLSQTTAAQRFSIRYKYIAALLALNEKQVIEIKPSATNYLISLQVKQAAPVLHSSFECTANIYHMAWFGYKNINEQRFRQFSNAVKNIINGDASA